ncbi:MAG: PDZ domain-containing protein [Planctomycetia bacterium]|nr:PDZ domain-containing protein [Planctomycetia bacterium]
MTDRREPRLSHAIAFSAMLLLAVAIAVAQNQVTKQGDPKNPSAAPQAKKAPAAPQADARPQQPAHRGHALGMAVTAGDQGIVVSKIDPAGAAGKAGFRENDRIVSVDQRPFKNARQLEAYLSSHAGRPVPVVVVRDGQQQTITYTAPFRSSDSAWLGVFLEQADGEAKGAEISQIFPDGPAARAGLQPGDVIVKIDNERIDNAADLIATVAGMAPQTESQFVITRNDQQVTIPVTLGSHEHQALAHHGNPQDGEGQQPQHHRGYNAFDTIPPHAMRLEHDRRNAEQHERIEEEIRALREEIRQLREELKQSRK